MVDYTESLGDILWRIKEMGLEIELDDFGTGYSSLGYLKRLPIAALKIDQGFVRGALTDRCDAAIVRSIVQLARDLKLKTIGEGAETVEQVDFLRQIGCDQVQGYFYSPPLEAGDFSWYCSRAARKLSA